MLLFFSIHTHTHHYSSLPGAALAALVPIILTYRSFLMLTFQPRFARTTVSPLLSPPTLHHQGGHRGARESRWFCKQEKASIDWTEEDIYKRTHIDWRGHNRLKRTHMRTHRLKRTDWRGDWRGHNKVPGVWLTGGKHGAKHWAQPSCSNGV